MLTSSTVIVACVAAFSKLGAATPLPQAQPTLISIQSPCYPDTQGTQVYIQAYDTANRVRVREDPREASPVSTLNGDDTRWTIEDLGLQTISISSSESQTFLVFHIDCNNEAERLCGLYRHSEANDLLIQPGKTPDIELGLVNDPV